MRRLTKHKIARFRYSILHAGDIYILPVLDELAHIAPILASEGDDVSSEIMNDKRVNWKYIINVEGLTIWFTHQYETWFWDRREKLPPVMLFRSDPSAPETGSFFPAIGHSGLVREIHFVDKRQDTRYIFIN